MNQTNEVLHPVVEPKTTELTFDNGDLIRVDEHNRWSLNDILTHSGSNKVVKDFTRLETTKAYVDALTDEMGGILPIEGKQQLGTFAHEELALEFAKWISLPLKREVNKLFLAYSKGEMSQDALMVKSLNSKQLHWLAAREEAHEQRQAELESKLEAEHQELMTTQHELEQATLSAKAQEHLNKLNQEFMAQVAADKNQVLYKYAAQAPWNSSTCANKLADKLPKGKRNCSAQGLHAIALHRGWAVINDQGDFVASEAFAYYGLGKTEKGDLHWSHITLTHSTVIQDMKDYMNKVGHYAKSTTELLKNKCD